MGALSDKAVGQYVSEHFVAAYEQVGDFEVVKRGDELKKNGGNVVTYFCTPRLHVVHAVAGPVAPRRLLEEARWARRTQHTSEKLGGPLRSGQRRIVEQAHVEALGGTMEQFAHHQKRQRSTYRGGRRARYGKHMVSQSVEIRRRAAASLGRDRAHRFLAAEPLPMLKDVYLEFFGGLTNERVSIDSSRVKRVAGIFERAKRSHSPVLLVLYKAQDDYGSYGKKTWQSIEYVIKRRPLSEALRNCQWATLPRRELPALSSYTELPIFELSGSGVTIVLTNHRGDQKGSFSGTSAGHEIAERLKQVAQEDQLAKAESLKARGDLSAARRILLKLSASADSQAVMASARQKLDSLPSSENRLTTTFNR